MSSEVISALLSFLGGLGLFLYGMDVMAEGLQQAAGNKTRKLLEAITNNRFMGMIAGALVTAIIQSSSATTVMVVGFVNAGLMSLIQACGVIMGANIGTTMTSWIVSMGEWAAFLKPEMIAPVLLVIGVGFKMFANKPKIKDGAKILIGFGVLFVGLSSMSGAIKPFTDAPIFKIVFETLGSNPLLAILAGAAVTAIIQSSSASMGILQTMAMAGAVNWGSAVFIALGQNIGTCITAVLSAISGDKNARRAAMIHLEFNVIGATIVGIAAFVFFMLNPSLMSANVNSSSLAIFHTGFNVFTTAMLFPFANALVKLSEYLVPQGKARSNKNTPVLLDERFQQIPNAAFNALARELEIIRDDCVKLIRMSRACLLENGSQEDLKNEGKNILNACIEVKKYCSGIEMSSLDEHEKRDLQRALFSARDLHQIASDAIAIAKINENGLTAKHITPEMAEQIKTISSDCKHTLHHLRLQAGMKDKKPTDFDAYDDRETTKQNCKNIRQLISNLRQFYLTPAQDHASQDNAWLFLEAADCYERIALRCLRLINEDTWHKTKVVFANNDPILD